MEKESKTPLEVLSTTIVENYKNSLWKNFQYKIPDECGIYEIYILDNFNLFMYLGHIVVEDNPDDKNDKVISILNRQNNEWIINHKPYSLVKDLLKNLSWCYKSDLFLKSFEI